MCQIYVNLIMLFFHKSLIFFNSSTQDPEDPDESPLRPALFIENFYDGIGKGSNVNRPDDEEEVDSGGLNKVIFCTIYCILILFFLRSIFLLNTKWWQRNPPGTKLRF